MKWAGELRAAGRIGQVLAPLFALSAPAVTGVTSAARDGGGRMFPHILQTPVYRPIGCRTTFPPVATARLSDCRRLPPVGAPTADRDDGDAGCLRGRSRPRQPAARVSGGRRGGGVGRVRCWFPSLLSSVALSDATSATRPSSGRVFPCMLQPVFFGSTHPAPRRIGDADRLVACSQRGRQRLLG